MGRLCLMLGYFDSSSPGTKMEKVDAAPRVIAKDCLSFIDCLRKWLFLRR